jgi:predicted RecA/RadA family phage recombinase
MAQNFVQRGRVVTVMAAANILSGAGVMIGVSLFGVATHDALNGAALEIDTEGVHTLPADNNLVIAVGDRVFWDAANSWVDKTAAAQVCVGVAVAAKLQAGTTVNVKLNGVNNTPAGT